jgi:cytochrome c peroxidase
VAHVGDGLRNNGLDLATVDAGAGNARFKVPSLRNIAVRAPYMHDGRFATLREVIDFYDNGVQPHPNLDPRLVGPGGTPLRLNLTPVEKDALEAFLRTLTDDALLTDIKFSDPFPR